MELRLIKLFFVEIFPLFICLALFMFPPAVPLFMNYQFLSGLAFIVLYYIIRAFIILKMGDWRG